MIIFFKIQYISLILYQLINFECIKIVNIVYSSIEVLTI